MSPTKAKTASAIPARVRHKALGFLQDAIYTLDKLAAENPDDIGGLARADAILEQVAKDIGVLRAQINHLGVQALRALPDHKFIDPELGEIAITATPKQVYDDDKVDTVLVIAAERAAEKAAEHGDNVPRAIVKAVRSVLTVAKPKKTALKAFGVEVDSISRTEFGTPSMKVTPLDPALLPPIKQITKRSTSK